MDYIQLLIAGHAWQTGALVAVVIAGLAFWRYGRRLERQTRERSLQQPH